jgi:hypothetical protein
MIISIIMVNKANKHTMLQLIGTMINNSSPCRSTSQPIKSKAKQARLHIIYCVLEMLDNEKTNLLPPSILLICRWRRHENRHADIIIATWRRN